THWWPTHSAKKRRLVLPSIADPAARGSENPPRSDVRERLFRIFTVYRHHGSNPSHKAIDFSGVPYRIRTGVAAVRGHFLPFAAVRWCPVCADTPFKSLAYLSATVQQRPGEYPGHFRDTDFSAGAAMARRARSRTLESPEARKKLPVSKKPVF